MQSEKEIALVIGEPYQTMRQRSSAVIGPAIPGHVSFNIPKSDARLRFTDPQYGFVTPLARFFTVIYRNELIYSVRMSPQIEPLLLDDTPQWRARLRDVNKGGKTYWQAGNQYQTMLVVNRFRDNKRPTEERYLITLALATPWVKPCPGALMTDALLASATNCAATQRSQIGRRRFAPPP